MPIRNGRYETRSDEQLFQTLADELLDEQPEAYPRSESTITYAFLWALAATIASNQEQSLKHVYESAYVQDATGVELSKKARNLGVVRRDAIAATGTVTFSRDEPPSSDITIPSGTVVETVDVDPVQFETTEPGVIDTSSTSVTVNVEAVEAGSEGNVGAGAIAAIPSPPAQLDVTNSQPIGDPSYTDTDGDPYVAGRDRENDDELRQRVLDTEATGEGPSAGGVEKAVENVEEVIDAYVYTNQTASTVDGLDPYHSEVVAYGGDTYDVARTLYETMSVTTLLRLQGGVHGSSETETVYSSLLDQDVSVSITRPNALTIAIDIDVVHTSEYAGDVAVKNAVVDYVGGTYADDSTVTGLGLGEDVLVNEVEHRAEAVDGVAYADVTLADTNGDGSDDATTDSDGVPIVSVANNEVPEVDADNVTLSKTSR